MISDVPARSGTILTPANLDAGAGPAASKTPTPSASGSPLAAAVATDPKSVALAQANARVKEGKQALTQMLSAMNPDAMTAADAAKIAKQIVAAAQEAVSLGGSRMALLEPSLPVLSSASRMAIQKQADNNG
ncbi:MAG: hypothetical protein RLZZ141_2075 [Pseudomonadota bacterium]|jgi:hypothetical protein